MLFFYYLKDILQLISTYGEHIPHDFIYQVGLL